MIGEFQSERRVVTVLFADIAEFTALAEKMDPENVTDIINEYFKISSHIINKYNGTVDSYIGDCVMAVFGAPQTMGNDSRNALLASMEILKSINKINKKFNKSLSVRIGIHTGLVIAGWVGSKIKRQYTVIGHTVNLAKRIEEFGEKNKIIVSEETYKNNLEFFKFRETTNKKYKGLKTSIKVYELIGSKRIEEKDTLFVDRKQEFDNVKKMIKESNNGIKHIVLLYGVSGVGKSRIVYEFKRWINRTDYLNNATILSSKILSSNNSIPYSIFIDILSSYFNIEEQDNTNTIKSKLRAKLEPYELPFIGTLFSVKFSTYQPGPDELKLGIHMTIKNIISKLTNKHLLVLIFEGIDYSDSSSIELLNQFVSDTEQKNLFICMTSYTPVMEKSEKIHIQAFSEENSKIMIDSLLQCRVSKDIENSIFEKTEGNPLFITETIKGIGNLNNISKIPNTVQEIIMSRVDKLNKKSKKILQFASVIGRESSCDILKQLAGNKLNIQFNLEELKNSGFLIFLPKNRYSFKHLIAQEVIYDSILIKQRKLLHNRIGHIIEILYENRIEGQYEILAYHYLKGSNKSKSIKYLVKSGNRSKELYNTDNALFYYKKVIDLMKDIKNRSEYVNVLKSVGDTLYDVGNNNEGMKWYKIALAESKHLNKYQIADIKRSIAAIYERSGQYDKSLRWCQDGLKNIRNYNNIIVSKILFQISVIYFRKANYKKTLEYAIKSRKIAKKLSHIQDVAFANSFIGHAYRFMGDFTNSEKYHKENLGIGKKENDLFRIAYSYDSLGCIYKDKDNLSKATNYLNKSLEIFEKINYPLHCADVYGDIGELYFLMGKPDNALKYYDLSFQIIDNIEYIYELIKLYRRYAEYYLFKGNTKRALHNAKKALELAKTSGEKLEQGRINHTLGKIYNTKKMHKISQECFNKSIDIFKNIYANYYLDKVHFDLDKINRSNSKN